MVLVGSNQSGKSSLLKALNFVSFSNIDEVTDQLTLLNNTYKKYLDKILIPGDLPIVSAHFTFEEDDFDLLYTLIAELPSPEDSSDDFDKYVDKNFPKQKSKFIIETKELSGAESTNNLPKADKQADFHSYIDETNKKEIRDILLFAIKGIKVTKFVDGSYSMKFGEFSFSFWNPTVAGLEVENLLNSMIDKVQGDFNRDPNKNFKKEFDTICPDLYLNNIFGMLSDTNGWLVDIYDFLNKGIDEPLKKKITEELNSLKEGLEEYRLSERKLAIIKFLYDKMPKMVFLDSYNILENSLTLEELRDNPDQHNTFTNLLELAEIKLESLIEQKDNTTVIQQYLETASRIATRKIRKAYRQEKFDLQISYTDGKLMVFTKDPEGAGVLLPPSAGSA